MPQTGMSTRAATCEMYVDLHCTYFTHSFGPAWAHPAGHRCHVNSSNGVLMRRQRGLGRMLASKSAACGSLDTASSFQSCIALHQMPADDVDTHSALANSFLLVPAVLPACLSAGAQNHTMHALPPSLDLAALAGACASLDTAAITPDPPPMPQPLSTNQSWPIKASIHALAQA